MIVESPVVVKQIDAPMMGVRRWHNDKNGFSVIDLAYYADPRKRDPNWITEAKMGLPIAEWNREYGEQWVVYEGKPVYQDFDEAVHVISGTIFAPSRSRLVSGWDAGPNDVNLAWALAVVQPTARRVLFIDEYCVDDGDAEDFLQVVAARLRLEWLKLGGFSLHVADQSVFVKTNIEARAFADLMRKHNMNPIAGEISFAGRRASVNGLLMEFTRGVNDKLVPRLQVHERCEILREAMRGGYCYPKLMSGIGGAYKETPMKNKFSHVANAMEYVCSRFEVAGAAVPFEGRPLPYRSLV